MAEPTNLKKSEATDQDLKIGILNPEAVTIEDDDGSVTIDFDPNNQDAQASFNDNLAEYMEDDELNNLGSEIISMYEEDRNSRSDWEDAYINGLDLLGVKNEERSVPFDGATGVTHPILNEATIRFVSQAMMELFPSSGPVKASIIGKSSPERLAQAQRVQDYMNYLLTEEIEQYRPDTEQLLFQLALSGSAFRKVYYDPTHDRPESLFVPAEDFVVSYETTDLKNSSRFTHVMRKTDNFVRRMQLNGFYRDVDIGEPLGDSGEVQTKYSELTGVTEVTESDIRIILETHVELDLKGFEDRDESGKETGLQLPYIVTVDESSGKVLSIRRNYLQEDPLKIARQHFVHYKFQPGLGFYGFGLIHLIGSIAKSSTSILRQLIDAGTLANLPAGFKARGLRIKGDDKPIEPGEFRDIDLPSGAIRDNILPLPFKEPSSTLAQLMGVLVDEGRRIASIADMNIGEGNQEAPVGTTLALIERSMKVMSAVHARLHASFRIEFKLLSNIIKTTLPQYPYEVDGDSLIASEDFDDRVDIIPVSDPNATSFAQRMMQHQAALQTASQAPQLYDMKELHRRFLKTSGLEDVDSIIPDTSNIPPYDPVSENARMMSGGPVKVFPYQDHDAHLSAHSSLLQDPSMAQNPMGKQIGAAISAHISEHMAHKYRNEAEKLMGTQIPPLDIKDGKGLSEEQEQAIAAQAAQAAAQITGKAQQQAVLEQQLQAAQDPVVQQQQAELQVKQAKIKQEDDDSKRDAQVEMEKAKMRSDLESKRLKMQKDIADDKIKAQLLKNKRQ
tara:strand:- start:7389 stop:9749 length:2361 start_codon:yes stop_codon:yes gene_type:complete